MGLFLEDGCIQLGRVKVGVIMYDNEPPIHDVKGFV